MMCIASSEVSCISLGLTTNTRMMKEIGLQKVRIGNEHDASWKSFMNDSIFIPVHLVVEVSKKLQNSHTGLPFHVSYCFNHILSLKAYY